MTLRRFLSVAIVVASFVFPSAAAARPTPPALTAQQTSAHFMVHYAPDFGDSAAQSVLASAERAYTAELALGFRAPLDDGDGHIDIYVQAIPDSTIAGFAKADIVSTPTPGSITLDPDPSKVGLQYQTIAHELFHLIQLASASQLQMSPLIMEGTATWMMLRLAGWTNRYWNLPSTLDCTPCDRQSSTQSPYDRWPFFAYLDDHFGPGILQQIFEQAGQSGQSGAVAAPLQPVDQALALHGTTLADTYGAFAAQEATLYRYGGHQVVIGDSGSGFSSLGIDRLSTQVVSIDTTGTSPRLCLSTTLTVTVTASEGALRPALVINRTVTPLTQTGDGSTWTVTIPGSPCTPRDSILLVLPNGSQTTAIPYAEVHADAGNVASVPPVATGGLTVILPAKVTLLAGVGTPTVWLWVTTAGGGTVYVQGGYGGVLQFPILEGGTHRIGVVVGANAGKRRFTFTFKNTAGKRTASITRVVVVRFRPPR